MNASDPVSPAAKRSGHVFEVADIEADLRDGLADALVALSGIADALSFRTAVFPDDMLELLANAAETQAEALRKLGITSS